MEWDWLKNTYANVMNMGKNNYWWEERSRNHLQKVWIKEILNRLNSNLIFGFAFKFYKI